ncbi:MAG: class I SAM-dependent methyltransferase [Anaerolineae bacterium]|nr:class I SAM-dependent methyltransferase [Anaerolineae bacterium]
MSFYADFAGHYEAIFPFNESVYALLRRYILLEHRRCLDVGCGTGHYSGRLAADGFDVVGIDLDAAMITYARQRYAQAAFHVMNMLDIASLVSTDQTDFCFDAAFCIGNTAAHLTQEQYAQFLDAAKRVLKPGVPWILQVMNWDFVLEREAFIFPVIEAPGGLTFHREYRDISTARVTFHTRLQSGADVIFEDEVPLYPLRSADVAWLHRERGFTLLDHFGNYAGAPFDPAAFSANIFVFAANHPCEGYERDDKT